MQQACCRCMSLEKKGMEATHFVVVIIFNISIWKCMYKGQKGKYEGCRLTSATEKGMNSRECKRLMVGQHMMSTHAHKHYKRAHQWQQFSCSCI